MTSRWRATLTNRLIIILERKCRDHIKDSFHSLRDSIPSLQGEKASRAQILDKATEYVQYMRRKNNTHQQDTDDLKRQNALLEQQVRALEKARSSAQLQTNYPSSDNSLYTNAKASTISAFDGAQTPAQSQSLKSPKAGRNSGWRPAKPCGAASNKNCLVSSVSHPPLSSSLEAPEPFKRLIFSFFFFNFYFYIEALGQ
jgi:Max protein